MEMSIKDFKGWLEAKGASKELQELADSCGYSMPSTYESCKKGSLLFEWAMHAGVETKALVRATTECVATCIPGKKNETLMSCIAVTRRWCEGQATDEEFEVAFDIIKNAAYFSTTREAMFYAMKGVFYAGSKRYNSKSASVMRDYISLEELVNPK